jgi:uncharacterized lipoprotein YmbA
MMKLAHGLFFLAFSMLITSCSSSSSSPISYYVIAPVIETPVAASNESLSLALMDVHIPQYLERFQIATRTGSNRLQLSDANQWGENLRKNLMRTMVRNLTVALGTIDIGTPINQTSSTPDYRVQVFIAQFEQGSDGYVRLAGLWQVTDGKSGKPLAINAFESVSGARLAEGDFPGIVDAMRDLLGEFCVDIANSIVAQEAEA